MHEWGLDENGYYSPGPAIPWGGSVDKTLNKSEDNNSSSLKWDFPALPTFNPPMGDKPIWENVSLKWQRNS